MPPHRHLPSELYVQTAAGSLPPSEASARVLEELAASCPDCPLTLETLGSERDPLRGALRALDRAPWEIGAAPPGADPPALDAPIAALTREVSRLRAERRRWKLDRWELRRLPRGRRRARVEDARSRFSSAGLAELLVGTGGELLTSEPGEAASLASLVPRVLARVPREETEGWAQSLILRAAARGADALRRSGDPAGAERAFRRLRAELAAHPEAPPDLVAEASAREAYLLADQRRPREAMDRLERAALLFRRAGDPAAAATVSLRRALLLPSDRREAALRTFEEVVAGLRDDDPPALWIAAVTGAVATLCDAGKGEDGERLLAAHVEVFESGGELLAGALYRGLEARVHAARGRSDDAARALAACRAAHRTLGRRDAGPLAAARRILEEIDLPSRTPPRPDRSPVPVEPPSPAPGPAHLSLDACLSVARGDLHPESLVRQAHEHLMALCAGCRAEWETAHAAAPRGELFPASATARTALPTLPSDPRRWLARDVEQREALLSRLRLVRRRAREDLSLLLSDPPWERLPRCEAARTRFASPALAELLVEAARAALPGDAGEALSLAELVPEVLGSVPGRETAWWQELAVRGRAEADRAAAALDLAQGRTREARRRLRKAARAFRRVDDRSGERRTLAELARLLDGSSLSSEALGFLERAASLTDPPARGAAHTTETLDHLLARVAYLLDLGRDEEAGELLDGHRDLVAEVADVATLASLCGLHGRIERARGHLDQAAESFEASRRGWLVTARPFEALLATIDLARLHLPKGRERELERLAATSGDGPRGGRATPETLAAFALALAPGRRASL